MRVNSARRRRALDDAAGIHHRDLVGAAGDDAEIVGDQDHRHVPPLLLARQQVEDLRLHRDVERGGRLVGDQQLGLAATARSRSPRAGACRRRAGADTGAAAARARACRPRPAARSRAPRRGRRRPGRDAPAASRRSACRWSAPGLSEVIGSWNTTASSGPRRRRSASRGRGRRGRGRRTSPGPSSVALAAASCRMARDSMVLPQPDSPTMPSVRPGRQRRDRRRRRRAAGRAASAGSTDTPSIDSRGCRHHRRTRPRIGERAQRVADDVEGQHGQEHDTAPAGRRATARCPGSRGPRRSCCPSYGAGGGTPRPRK